jgi:hypothetical protein
MIVVRPSISSAMASWMYFSVIVSRLRCGFVKSQPARQRERRGQWPPRWRSPPDSFHTTLTHQCFKAIFEMTIKEFRARFLAPASISFARGRQVSRKRFSAASGETAMDLEDKGNARRSEDWVTLSMPCPSMRISPPLYVIETLDQLHECRLAAPEAPPDRSFAGLDIDRKVFVNRMR